MQLTISHSTSTDAWIRERRYLHSTPAGAVLRMEFREAGEEAEMQSAELNAFRWMSVTERQELRIERMVCGGRAKTGPSRHAGKRMQRELLTEWDRYGERLAVQLFEQAVAAVAEKPEKKVAWETTQTEKILRDVMKAMEKMNKQDEKLRRRVERELGPLAPLVLGPVLFTDSPVLKYEPSGRCPVCGGKRFGHGVCFHCDPAWQLGAAEDAGDR